MEKPNKRTGEGVETGKFDREYLIKNAITCENDDIT